MEKTEKELLLWKRVTGGAVLGILAAMLVLTVCAVRVLIQFSSYETRIDAIVNRLDAVSQELSQVPIEEIAGTLHGISTELDSADIQGIIRAVRSLSDQLEAMDWEELSRQADGILLDTQESLAKAGETMEKAAQALDELDIEALNAAIADLQTVIEPLALLAGRFG